MSPAIRRRSPANPRSQSTDIGPIRRCCARPLRWLATALFLLAASALAQNEGHPLKPSGRSSPRATLTTFLDSGDAVATFLARDYLPSPSLTGFRLIMLFLTGLLAALYLVYIVYQQAGVIVEARRASRDVAAQRELADKAEASRFTELRSFLESELRKLGTDIAAVQTETSRRVEAAEQALAGRLVEASNGLAAHLGEVEDKIDRTIQSRG